MIDTTEMNRVYQIPPRMNGSHSWRNPVLTPTVAIRKPAMTASTTTQVRMNRSRKVR